MSPTDPSLADALARARDERRRRLAGSLDAVALTRSNTARASRAIVEQAQRLSAELDPPTPEGSAEVDRGGWGPRRPSTDDGILRPVHDAPPPPPPARDERGRDSREDGEEGENGEDGGWLR